MTQEYWQNLSFPEQMGNIGSEVNRVFHWQAKGIRGSMVASFNRTLELLDATIADQRWRPRLRELTRLREVVCDAMNDSKFYMTDPEGLKKYFLDFAILVRK